MKKNNLLLALIACLLLAAGCSQASAKVGNENATQNSSTKITETTEVSTVVSSTELIEEDVHYAASIVCFAEHFTKPEDPAKNSSVIVTGKVTHVENILHTYDDNRDEPFTLITVKVTKDYRGVLKAGEEVKFLETGGTYTQDELNAPQTNNDSTTTVSPDYKIVSLYGGVENTKVDQQVLFFGIEVTDDSLQLNIEKPYYSTISAFRGRYLLDKKTNEYVRADVVQKDSKIAPLENYDDLSDVENVPNDEQFLKDLAKNTPFQELK